MGSEQGDAASPGDAAQSAGEEIRRLAAYGMLLKNESLSVSTVPLMPSETLIRARKP
jgi:hypothetical protein